MKVIRVREITPSFPLTLRGKKIPPLKLRGGKGELWVRGSYEIHTK